MLASQTRYVLCEIFALCVIEIENFCIFRGVPCPYNPGHYCMDVKMSKGNVIPSLNGSQLYSSHPKQKCTKIYPEETAPGPRPLPYMGKILTFDRKVVETPFFFQNDHI